MRHRYFPLILLYGFGLTLLLSLGFNGFLLYQQSYPRNVYEYESAHLADAANLAWQQRLLDCDRANHQKDSLIRLLEQATHAPPRPVNRVDSASGK